LVEINPKDEMGNLLKRRGLYLKNTMELEKFTDVIDNEKLKVVLVALENISGVKEEEKIKPLDLLI
jgi:dUTPase